MTVRLCHACWWRYFTRLVKVSRYALPPKEGEKCQNPECANKDVRWLLDFEKKTTTAR